MFIGFLARLEKFNNNYKRIIITRLFPLIGEVVILKTRAIVAIALIGLMIGSVLAVMPAAEAKELSEKNKTIYIHYADGGYTMSLSNAADGDSTFESDGAEYDCPMIPALNTTVNFDTSQDVEIVFAVGIGYLSGLPTSYDYTATIEATLKAGSKQIGTGSGSVTMDIITDQTESSVYTIEIKFKPEVESISPADGNLNLHFKLSVTSTIPDLTGEGCMMSGQDFGSSTVKLPISSVLVPGNETIGGNATGNITGDNDDAGTGGEAKTPGFETVAIVAAVGASVLLFRRRKC